jgi:hypothetical protein
MINQIEIPTNKKPRRRPRKPLTPLQQAELANPMPKNKIMVRMRRQADRQNARFGIKSRAGKCFDLATGLELSEAEVNRRVQEYEERLTKAKSEWVSAALRGEEVNVPLDQLEQVHQQVRLYRDCHC